MSYIDAHLDSVKKQKIQYMQLPNLQRVMAVFLQELCNKLQTTLAAAQHPSCINNELERLSLALTSLADAKKKRNKKSKDIQSWLCDFQQAAYDAYDFVNCLPLRAPQVNDVHESMQVRRSCFLVDNCAPRQPAQHIELIIKDIRRRVEKLVKKHPPCAEIHLRLQQSDGMNSEVQRLGVPSDERGVIGRDEDREKIIQLLTSEESSQMDLSLIAIVGKAGVGKTILARHVCDDVRVARHFHHMFWFSASEINDTEGLSRSIALRLKTPQFLEEKRFILILDDFRSGVFEWEKLHEQLEVGLKGSKIVITTEDEEATKSMGLPNCFHNLQCLSHGDSWSLFSKCAGLANSNVEEFQEVGMKFVEKLQGLPLAATMVGSLLCSNFDLNDWNIILNADVWKSEPDELCGIPAALWLSYQRLPRHIKRCFTYCSVFPRDHIFDKDDLVHMWIAQGLIQPQEGTTMEDSGSEYFDYLVHRSFLSFQDRLRFFPEHEGRYIMHNLIHRLAVAMALDESLILSGVDPTYEGIGRSNYSKRQQKKVRYLYLQSDHLALSQVTGLSMLGEIETLVFYRTNGPSFNYDALFKKLKSIRVLYLCDMQLKILPESIAELKQLRCLDLSNTSVRTVSEQVCSLYNLQTLKLCTSLFVDINKQDQTLPKQMSQLVNLRHFKARNSHEIYQIGRLTCLQDIGYFDVSREEGHKIEELKYMNQLTGSLCICDLNNVYTAEEAKEAALNDKEHVRRLALRWDLSDASEDGCYKEEEEVILEALKPNPNLKELEIFGYWGTTTPSWLEDGSLCNLEDLHISNCENLDLLLLGQLQSLKSLRVFELPELQWLGPQFLDEGEDVQLFPHPRILSATLEELKLKEVGLQVLPGFLGSETSTSSFSLTSLHLSDCHSLATLHVGLLEHQNHHRLQALTRLTIEYCPELVYLPDHGFSALVSLKYLHIHDCQLLQCNPVSDVFSANLPSSLIELKIIECPRLTNDSFFNGIERLHALKSLVIMNERAYERKGSPPFYQLLQLPPLTSLPVKSLQHLKALKELVITTCVHLQLLGFHSLESLEYLKVVGCPKLVAGPPPVDTSPIPLDYLEISESSLLMLTGEVLGKLTFLRVLKLISCFQLSCFPKSVDDGLHCLVSLKELHIFACNDLESLPSELASIPSLKELHITACRKLKFMPDKGVPPSLELLALDRCGDLGQRCLLDHEDWPKISHVFFVLVDGEDARDSNNGNIRDYMFE